MLAWHEANGICSNGRLTSGGHCIFSFALAMRWPLCEHWRLLNCPARMLHATVEKAAGR